GPPNPSRPGPGGGTGGGPRISLIPPQTRPNPPADKRLEPPAYNSSCLLRYCTQHRGHGLGGERAVEYWTAHESGCLLSGGLPSDWPRATTLQPAGRGSDAGLSTDRSNVAMTTRPETRYRVRGGHPLQGTVFVQGAKNAALKMIAASLLADKGRTVLRNVPVIEDVRRAVELAQAVGAVVKFHEAGRT